MAKNKGSKMPKTADSIPVNNDQLGENASGEYKPEQYANASNAKVASNKKKPK